MGKNTLFLNVTTRSTYSNHRVKRLKFGERYFAQGIRSTAAYNIELQKGFDFRKPHAYVL